MTNITAEIRTNQDLVQRLIAYHKTVFEMPATNCNERFPRK